MPVELWEHFSRVGRRMMLEQTTSFLLSFMLYSNLVFLNFRLLWNSFLVSDIQMSYCLTNLSGAVSFLQNCGGCDFDIDPDEFERQYNKTAPVPVVDEDEEDLLQF